MRGRNLPGTSVGKCLGIVNQDVCVPPLPLAEVSRISASVARYDPSEEPCTDLGNARRFARMFYERCRYVPERKSWIVWDGALWRQDPDGVAERYAKCVPESIRVSAGLEFDEARRDMLLKWAKLSESQPRIQALLALAKTEPKIPLHETELDQVPDLLCVRNGVVDLRTFTFR